MMSKKTKGIEEENIKEALLKLDPNLQNLFASKDIVQDTSSEDGNFDDDDCKASNYDDEDDYQVSIMFIIFVNFNLCDELYIHCFFFLFFFSLCRIVISA